MSYASLTKIEIKVVANGLPKVIKKCPKCGGGSHFVSTGKFRVNANKKYLDIWLIYQCEKCKSTWNMTIYERLNPKSLDGQYLERLMNNDEELAKSYGFDQECLRRNGGQMDYSGLVYTLNRPDVDKVLGYKNEVCIRFSSQEELPCKVMSLLSDLLELSGSRVRKLAEQGLIKYSKPKKFHKEKLGREKEVVLSQGIWERVCG